MNTDSTEAERIQELLGLDEALWFINLTNRCEVGGRFSNMDMSKALVMIDRLSAELAKAREVIDRLPKTADGVPIVDGIDLFPSDPTHIIGCHSSMKAYWVTVDGQHVVDDPRKFYSTEAAALAAKGPTNE